MAYISHLLHIELLRPDKLAEADDECILSAITWGAIWGRDNGKENGNYYFIIGCILGLCRGYIGIMEKKMEAAIL